MFYTAYCYCEVEVFFNKLQIHYILFHFFTIFINTKNIPYILHTKFVYITIYKQNSYT